MKEIINHIADMCGKVVDIATKGRDDKGYDFLTIRFTDGTVYNVVEHSQTGEIKQYWT